MMMRLTGRSAAVAKALTTVTKDVPQRGLHASRPSTFLVRSLEDAPVSHDGDLESRRLLLRSDGCGFSVQHEILKQGKSVQLTFQNHVYAFLVTRGHGKLQLLDAQGKSATHLERQVKEGSFIALNANESVKLVAESEELHAVSVMNPPLAGAEERKANGVFPVTDEDGVEHDAYDQKAVQRLFEAPESLKGGSKPMKDDPLF